MCGILLYPLSHYIQDLTNDKASGVTVELDRYNDMHLKGVRCLMKTLLFYSLLMKNPLHLQTLKGPSDTPYEGGIFEVDIIIPNEYPFTPPKMKFITKGK